MREDAGPQSTVLSPQSFLARLARPPYRTLPALRDSRGADQRSQLHDRLVVRPRRPAVPCVQPGGGVPEAALAGGAARPRVKRPPEHPGHVGVHRGLGALEREARHGAGGVPADARQPPQRRGVRRDGARLFVGDDPRQLVEVGGAPVVAEALPALPHRRRPRSCQGVHGGKPGQEPRPVRLDPRHLRLLEHEFGHQHRVGIAGTPPGEVAPVLAEPPEEPAAELRRGRGCATRGGLRWHGRAR